MDGIDLKSSDIPFTSIIRFQVKPGAEANFEAAFGATGMLTRPKAIDGFLDAKLVRSEAEPAEYLVIGEWRTQEAYTNWQSVSGKNLDANAMARLLDTPRLKASNLHPTSFKFRLRNCQRRRLR